MMFCSSPKVIQISLAESMFDRIVIGREKIYKSVPTYHPSWKHLIAIRSDPHLREE